MTLLYQPTSAAKAGPVERLIRWWLSELQSLIAPNSMRVHWRDRFEANYNCKSIICTLPEQEGFIAQIHMPEGAAEAHKNALELKLDALLPLPSKELICVFGEATNQVDAAVAYTLIAMRDGDLERFETELKTSGARAVRFELEGYRDLYLCTPSEARSQRVYIQVLTALCAGLVASLWLALSSWTAALERQLFEFASAERSQRIELAQARSELDHLQHSAQWVARMDFSSATTLHADLLDLKTALPEALAIRSIEWTPASVGLELTEAPGSDAMFSWPGWRVGETTVENSERGLTYERILSEVSP